MEDRYIFEKRFDSNYLSKPHFKGSLGIIIAFIIAMILFSEASWQNWFGLASELSVNYTKVSVDGEYWRLFTSFLVHGDLKHLLSNLFFFSLFAYYVHQYFGPKVFPISSIIAGAVINYITILGMNPNIYLVGASGIVYYLGGFWLVIYLFIERHKSIRMRVGRSLGVCLVLLGPGPFSPEVSYMAHFWGFVVGAFFAIGFYFFNRTEIQKHERFRTDIVENITEDKLQEELLEDEFPPSQYN